MNAIFLDVDGVICLKGGFDLDHDCLQNLADLVNLTDAIVIVSSTWRLIPPSMAKLESTLKDIGVTCIKKTKDFSGTGLGRSAEIMNSLKIFRMQGVDNWVILDDHDVRKEHVALEQDATKTPEIVDHFVQTDRRRGFDGHALVKALKILA